MYSTEHISLDTNPGNPTRLYNIMAGMYIKRGSIDLQQSQNSVALRRRSDSYHVNGQKANQAIGHNRLAELKAVELTKLSYPCDSLHPQNIQEFKSPVNENNISVTVQNNKESTLNDTNQSWWYILCLKCRKKEVGPGWEPKYWSAVCPHPYGPSFRHVARILALLLTVLLFWGVVFNIKGQEAGPGGQLFNIAVLVIAAYMGGWLFRMFTLPALVGMLLVGILFQNVGLIHIDDHYKEFVTVLRKIALVVIFTRAGLDLDPEALKKLFSKVLILALIPWCAEAAAIAVTANYLLDLPWSFAMLCGSIMAAVSPAVVVPCLIRLRTKGYGVAKGIPTLIIAVAGIDDAASVIAFGVGTSMIFQQNSSAYNLLLCPATILIGLTYGVVWGFIVKYVPERSDPYVVPLRTLMLTGGGLVAVLSSEGESIEGAGPLAVIIAAFTSMYFWTKQGWDIEDNPVATAFEIFWMVFEPILFGLTGTQIVFNQLQFNVVVKTVICVTIAFMFRILITILAASGSSLNFKEKLFIALSWMTKASVQAVLGPAVLEVVKNDETMNNEENRAYATTIVMVCIISIILTAPMGATIVSLSGSKLLTKAKPSAEQWRSGPRPSIRDITLNSEDEETNLSSDREAECIATISQTTVEIPKERI